MFSRACSGRRGRRRAVAVATEEGISDGERRRRGRRRGFGANERSGLDLLEGATAELLDTVGRREVDGGRGYSDEGAATASAMVGER